jgi:hypothetical protein
MLTPVMFHDTFCHRVRPAFGPPPGQGADTLTETIMEPNEREREVNKMTYSFSRRFAKEVPTKATERLDMQARSLLEDVAILDELNSEHYARTRAISERIEIKKQVLLASMALDQCELVSLPGAIITIDKRISIFQCNILKPENILDRHKILAPHRSAIKRDFASGIPTPGLIVSFNSSLKIEQKKGVTHGYQNK